MSGKRCPRCREEKAAAEFSPLKSGRLSTYCRGCQVARVTAWRASDPSRAQELRERNYRAARLKVLAHYSGGQPRCACCGETQYEFLSIDHIDGGGTRHQQEVGRGAGILRWLVREGFPSGFRVLCHNCNQARGVYGRCPHEIAKEGLA